MKKGQVSAQFNWIFILIAGAIILTFFISIVNNQQKQADVKISVNVLRAFDTLVKASSVQDKSTQIISMPNQDIEFFCEIDTCTVHGCYSGYQIPGTGVMVAADFKTLFSPRLLRGSKLITSNLDWNVPFRVSNLLYVTTDKNRYIFFNSSKFSLYEEIIPDNITKDVVDDLSEVSDMNYYNVRYVFFNEDDNAILNYDFMNSKEGRNPKNVSVVNIKADSNMVGSTSYFYVNVNPRKTNDDAFFFDNATMVATLFSENSQIYNCNMVKTFNQYLRIAGVYNNKLENLDEQFSTGSCSLYPYIFDGIINPIRENIQNINSVISAKKLNINSINSIKNEIDALEQLNSRKRDDSCPVIY